MNRIKILIAVIPFAVSCAISDKSPAFRKPENPIQTVAADWKDTKPKLYASFSSTDIKFEKQIPPDITISSQQTITAWKGERVNLQLLIWSSADIDDIRVTASTLKEPNGNSISANNINVHPVRYVLSDEFLTGCGYRDKDTIPAYLVADILKKNQPFNLIGKTTRPVWITIDLPANVTPGSYQGDIIKKPEAGDAQTLNLNLEVQDFTLPAPSGWAFHLDLWQNPYSIARLHNTELWSDEHLQACLPYL
ncbi:hypothetical protein [Marinilabilia salmonicolor]|uniref:hypothetical protein n=1 Tax=Marinilabilia salmonicolor TaxID=989 RepID=UPI00029A3873|nr:hypothetical protein [Marinilabilia salmonicolor]